MKLKLNFGMAEPSREVNWWQPVKSFPHLVLYKNKKWEFFFYEEDPSKQVDYICQFSEVPTYDPNWYASDYMSVDHLLAGYGGDCQCGAIYTSFPNAHMFFCPRWSRF